MDDAQQITSLDDAVPQVKDGELSIEQDPLPESDQDASLDERMAVGRRLRLAMAIIGADDPEAKARELARLEPGGSDNKSEAEKPLSVDELSRQLRAIHQDADGQLCRRIELLVEFDEVKGWRSIGAKHCIQWMGSELSIGPSLAFEQLRVGRKLRKLPVLRALFRRGRIGWCKMRLLTRVADGSNEELLASAALDATVNDVQRLCDEFRWPVSDDDEDEAAGGDSARARALYERRSLTWRRLPDTNTEFRLILPPELAQNVMKSLEHCEDMLFNDDLPPLVNDDTESVHQQDSGSSERPHAPQRRADAAVMMAERSLAHAGNDVARADRYQVIVTVDADALLDDEDADDGVVQGTADNRVQGEDDEPESDCRNAASDVPHAAQQGHDSSGQGSSDQASSNQGGDVPLRNPVIEGGGPIAPSTALKLLCDCRASGIVKFEGEPISIGRKTRIWPTPMRQAILERDRHCQFPGCDANRHLVIHHINHWVHGGETSVENGICLCQSHHTLVHDESYRIRRKSAAERRHEFTTTNFRKDDGTSDEKHPEDYWEFALRRTIVNAEGVDTLMKRCNRFSFERGADRGGCGEYGSDYEHDYCNDYGNDYERDYGSGHGRDYGSDYGSDYGRDDGSDDGEDMQL